MENTFRTPVVIKPSEHRISHHSKILLLGSCFSEHIGGKLEEYQFPVVTNPAGIQYNPASISEHLARLCDGTAYTDGELQYANELWFSWDHHGSFSNPDKRTCLREINAAFTEGAKQVRQAKYICITFGTAYYYYHQETGRIVSNCHKRPAEQFERKLLKPEEIFSRMKAADDKLRKVNPRFTYIFTVSPVRHLKDGFRENQVSKSILHIAVDEMCSAFEAEYFPAYEILMDDLRDYRFYEEDMIHPGKNAADYIWDLFQKTYMDTDTRSICGEIDSVLKGLRHRPLHGDTDSYRRFAAGLRKKTAELTAKYPFLSFPE